MIFFKKKTQKKNPAPAEKPAPKKEKPLQSIVPSRILTAEGWQRLQIEMHSAKKSK